MLCKIIKKSILVLVVYIITLLYLYLPVPTCTMIHKYSYDSLFHGYIVVVAYRAGAHQRCVLVGATTERSGGPGGRTYTSCV